MKKDGRFIVLEGIDGSGTTTQLSRLHDYLRRKSKYADVLTTHEPWDSDEIKKILAESRDAYSGGKKMTELYVLDRLMHVKSIVQPNLEKGVDVLSDRYAMSTFAYQGTQGIDIDILRKLHQEHSIITPHLTLFLDVDYKTARKRIELRGETLEKFERNETFTKRLIENYRMLALTESSLGRIVIINGNRHLDQVTSEITENFDKLFSGRCK